MEDKVKDGSTYLTKIHHRESPMRILYSQADVAPVWTSEVVYQKLIGHPVEGIKIPDSQNTTATYVAAKLKMHPMHRQQMISSNLWTPHGQTDLQKYGFTID
ncbi:substrate-binding domain-containing protein [Sphingobacterium sp. E70]|uniref:substrate-binding domain-containing protein n=1 Tax=Sphingobacterium sp. E70 TaxID=2853439 RepID=UPI00211CB70F|nr:substrate-binding domain-containing protein [Sphingobacterium sp. E70]ULT27489.1 substrate-binding domain-containing protein [Sphingobacterium sp. E70]